MIDLRQGDCLELMKDIPDGSIDMILCDLPYGTTACKWDVCIPFEPLWEQYERICKSNGVIILFGSEPFSSKLRMSNLKRYKYDWIWQKDNGSGFLNANQAPLKNHENISVFYSSDIMNDTTLFFDKSKDYLIGEMQKAKAAGFNMKEVLGNYMGSHYFTQKTQFAFPKREDYIKLQTTGFFSRSYDEAKAEYDEAKAEYDEAKAEYDEAKAVTYNPQFTKGKAYSCKRGSLPITIVGDKQNTGGHITKNDGKRFPNTVIKFNKETGLHPTQKPVALLEYLIKTYTNEGETVLDNCMGSGSTGIACVNTNRNFIGIELDEDYFNIAEDRINKRILEKGEK